MTITLEKILLAEMLWLLAASIEGITVERNYFAYYKLPVKLINANPVAAKHNKSQIAYVLQCPHRSSVDIPHPRDMEKCNIVSHYREAPAKHTKQPKTTKLNILYKVPEPQLKLPIPTATTTTKLNILYKVPEPQLKLPIPTATTTTKPWLASGEYLGSYEDCHTKNPTESRRPRKRRRPRPKSRTKWSKRLIRESKATTPEDEQEEEEDLTGISGEEHNTESVKETPTSLQTKPEKILKMFNVKSAIAAFRRSLLQPSIFVANHVNRTKTEGEDDNGDTLEMDKFFAQHVSSDKRDKRLGYHNMYHRDETYSDHIFYDDFDEGGAFASDSNKSSVE